MCYTLRMMRVFLAIPVQPSDCQRIRAFIQPIVDQQGGQITWNLPDNWHITMRFLGEVSANKIAAISQAVDKISHATQSFKYIIKKIAGFPEDNSRLLALHLVPNETLRLLFRQLDDAIDALGLGKEERSFAPHITLGKFQGPDHTGESIPIADCSLSANQLILYESQPSSEGSQYTPLQTFIFSN